MDSLRIKRGDTHSLMFTISGDVDLTGATGQIHVRSRLGAVITNSVTMNGSNATWQLDGSLEPGAYEVEIELTVDGKKTTAPSSGYLRLVVEDDLA